MSPHGQILVCNKQGAAQATTLCSMATGRRCTHLLRKGHNTLQRALVFGVPVVQHGTLNVQRAASLEPVPQHTHQHRLAAARRPQQQRRPALFSRGAAIVVGRFAHTPSSLQAGRQARSAGATICQAPDGVWRDQCSPA